MTLAVRLMLGLGVFMTMGLSQSSKPLPQVVFLNLRPHGFEPAQVTLKAGRMFLAIHNSTGKANPIFHVVSKSGGVVSQGLAAIDMVPQATTPHQTMFLNLAPGTYTVTEASQPSWTCTLTLQ
jgi:hypothetical protein